MMYRMYDLIQKKKDKKELSRDEIFYMINAFTTGEISNEQMSAFCMAVYFNGMNAFETAHLTQAMVESGDVVDLSGIDGVKMDKHSTGGVGDKTTFIIMSIVASLGIKVAKMSGRGLGHTGGTLDKIEAIPGFKIDLEPTEFIKNVNEIGASLAGQTGELVPADKKLYALRDVTATVDNISLIAASVMSKKIASGSNGIVLDVKTGTGAFMKTLEESLELASEMVSIGNIAGRKIAALVTDMNVPTGNAIGNTLEVIEAIEVLTGAGPDDLKSICLELASNMIHLAINLPIEDARTMAQKQIENGAAYEKFKEIVQRQGGDISYIENPSLFKVATIKYELLSKTSGYISEMNAQAIGTASSILGAGRIKATDKIDYAAGIVLKAKTGSYVATGDVIAVFHTNNERVLQDAISTFTDGLKFSETPPEEKPLIYARVTVDKIEKY